MPASCVMFSIGRRPNAMPEQKAFYEYGKAVESLKDTIQKIRKYSIYEFGEPYLRLTKSERKCLISAMDLAGQIHTVRQKRAACRAWMIPSHERICENCAYESTHPCATPCSECFRFPFTPAYEGFSDNWEPRKERE